MSTLGAECGAKWWSGRTDEDDEESISLVTPGHTRKGWKEAPRVAQRSRRRRSEANVRVPPPRLRSSVIQPFLFWSQSLGYP